MKLTRTFLTIILAGILLAIPIGGLMWLGSHKYYDNEANFRRIFGHNRPAEITVYRSEFWEGRHFFFLLAESSSHIEMDVSEKFLDELKQSGGFTYPASSPAPHPTDLSDWFAPKPVEAYDRWDSGDSNGGMYVDRKTGRVFLYYNAF